MRCLLGLLRKILAWRVIIGTSPACTGADRMKLEAKVLVAVARKLVFVAELIHLVSVEDPPKFLGAWNNPISNLLCVRNFFAGILLLGLCIFAFVGGV
jgi:hypothetical protein